MDRHSSPRQRLPALRRSRQSSRSRKIGPVDGCATLYVNSTERSVYGSRWASHMPTVTAKAHGRGERRSPWGHGGVPGVLVFPTGQLTTVRGRKHHLFIEEAAGPPRSLPCIGASGVPWSAVTGALVFQRRGSFELRVISQARVRSRSDISILGGVLRYSAVVLQGLRLSV